MLEVLTAKSNRGGETIVVLSCGIGLPSANRNLSFSSDTYSTDVPGGTARRSPHARGCFHALLWNKLMLEAGSQPLPGFRLTQRLGAGAFGEVWEAQDPDGKLVALKFMDCRTKSSTLISSEIRVLRALSELNHPN